MDMMIHPDGIEMSTGGGGGMEGGENKKKGPRYYFLFLGVVCPLVFIGLDMFGVDLSL